MQEATASYVPVYHFVDERLFEAFLTDIPRNVLVDYLRSDESLRNRYFPGHRISATVPSAKQISAAFRREVTDRKNSQLASSLCSDWIRQRSELARAALDEIGVQSPSPSDADSWIGSVHAAVTPENREEKIRALVSELGSHFPEKDVHIFVSLISHGADQLQVRQLVERELLNAVDDPAAARKTVSGELEAAKSDLRALEALIVRTEAESKATLDAARAAIDLAIRERAGAEELLSTVDSAISDLTTKIGEIETQIRARKHERGDLEGQKDKTVKALRAKQGEISVLENDFEDRMKKLVQQTSRRSAQIAELEEKLRAIDNRIAAEAKTLKTLEAPQSQAQEGQLAKHISGPLVPQAAVRADDRKTAVGNNAICYQAIQRTFRNAVVSFLRDRLTRLFPADHGQRMKRSFDPDEWEKAAQNAKRSREILGTATTIRDDYDLLGTNHFFGIFDRYYDKIFTPEAGQPPSLPRPVKPRFLGNLKAIKDGRDPLSHPVEEEISSEEARRLLYAAQETLKWLGCDAQVAELTTLTGQLDDNEPDKASVLRRLPSEDGIYLDWVERKTLLDDLGSCFSNPDNKRCLLAGDGGKGKSAAAYRFAQGLSANGRFQLVVWLSAKQRRFREGETVAVESPDFTTAIEAIDRLLIEYGATKQDMAASFAERKRLLFEYLDEFPAFIVADDIDTLLDDDEVVSLFTYEVPHTQSCVLLTSRRAIPGVRTLVVAGFDAVESEEFIKSRIRLYQLSTVNFTPQIIRDIARQTDGSPLYMDDLMRLAKIVDVQNAIRIWSEKEGDEARKYALQRETEKLSGDARKILVAAAVTDEPISFAELQDILGMSEDRLLVSLKELQTLFLFPKAPAVKGEQRYQLNLNTKKLVRFVEGSSEFYARIDKQSKAVAGKLPLIGHGVVAQLIRQALLRFNAGQNAEAESILLAAIEKYPNAPDLYGVLGFIYKRIGRIADARAKFEASHKFKSKNPEMYLHWLKMEIAREEWTRALDVANKALFAVPSAYEIVERKVSTLRQAGFELHRGMHWEKAVQMWTDAVEEVKKSIRTPETLPAGARTLNSSMYYSIVVCLDMLNRLEERNEWLERWEKEHGDDPQVALEKEFLIRKRGTLEVTGYRA